MHIEVENGETIKFGPAVYFLRARILYCLTTEAVVYSNKFNNSYKYVMMSKAEVLE